EEKIYHRQIYKNFLSAKVLSENSLRRNSGKSFFKTRDLHQLLRLDEPVKRIEGRSGGGRGSTVETEQIFGDVAGIKKQEKQVNEGEEEKDEVKVVKRNGSNEGTKPSEKEEEGEIDVVAETRKRKKEGHEGEKPVKRQKISLDETESTVTTSATSASTLTST